MRYRLLGKTGLRVSELCLGTMTFGDDWEFGADETTCRSMFDAFSAAGGNFIDTANSYTAGTSERLVGKCIAAERDYYVVSTKYSLTTRPSDPNAGGNSRKNMMRCVEESLRALGTEYIDIYWVHVWDGVTAIEEFMRGLDDLVRSGKVRYLGISDTPAWVVARANTLAELRGWTPFVALQTEYSLIERTSERDLLPMADALDLSVLAWAPLGGGVLSGKYERDGQKVRIADSKRGAWLNGDRINARTLDLVDVLAEIARQTEHSAAQLALAWLLARPNPAIPIVAARTLTQMLENLRCLDCVLNASQLAALDEASKIELGFPHRFLRYAPLRQALLGDKREQFA
ncbi:MAG TPA: aldo/keto reductase [Candidatus Baltobacteraceae bacterium]